MAVLTGWLADLWKFLRELFRILFVARISIVVVLLATVVLLFVPQAGDAIIALANFGSPLHIAIMAAMGIIWGLLVWFWARVFYYLEYTDYNPGEWQLTVIKNTPRVLGGLAFLALAVSFFRQGFIVGPADPFSAHRLYMLSLVYLVMMVFFLLFVYFRRRLFGITDSILYSNSTVPGQFQAFSVLPGSTKAVMLGSTAFSLVILAALVIAPIHSTIWLGDAITVLVCAFCIWIPPFYWGAYLSSRLRFPFFVLLFILAAAFSLFNSNKNVRLTAQAAERNDVRMYYEDWYSQRVTSYRDYRGKLEPVPTIMVLSEGGGIRAAYWSAGVLSYLQSVNSNFAQYTFGIYGISGGSFGASVFQTLLAASLPHDELRTNRAFLVDRARAVVGKDYLSPVVASMFTQELLQLFLPFPVSVFDHAKVFEKTWEYHWKAQVSKPHAAVLGNSAPALDKPLALLWQNDTNHLVPAMMMGSTRVEDGNPYLVPSLAIKDPASGSNILGINGDLYEYTAGKDFRVSTAALLSARFPYFGPAGILKKDKIKSGFVDGGYFDNSAAAMAYQVFLAIEDEANNGKKDLASVQFRKEVKPIVIYLKNDLQPQLSSSVGRTIFYQLTAPLQTFFNVQSSQAQNALQLIRNYVELRGGEFIVLPIDPSGGTRQSGLAIPLGWALSASVQHKMDMEITNTVNKNCSNLLKLLPK